MSAGAGDQLAAATPVAPLVSSPVPPPADRGATRIADRVVRRVAGRAAEEVLRPGGGEVVRASADVHGSRVDRIHLDVGLAYPAHLETSGAELQRRVTERTAHLTGLTVSRTAVRITRLSQSPTSAVESTEPAKSTASAESVAPRAGRRPWSERRAPAAVFALIGAVVSGALLADVVAVAVGRAPSDVRVRTLDWLTSHGPADTVVAVGAAVATVAGLWLVFVALTPGLRGRLAMSGTRAGIDRPAAAALVRHRAADVPGVSRVRVTAGRRRIAIRARLSFGDPVGARDVLTRVSQDVVTGLGLAKPPRVRVRVSRDEYWQPPRTQDREHDREHDRERKEATPDANAPAPAP
ncbi:DUF6286 domain-containing Asp23/Gls24 family envelope stress response protein [Streptomyces sp. NPDC057137]|uniref:DUF6286 domain-containing Asp23/Gls24 family envelope stress response protein n=1 Tax=Streptomyces sp. NPDC057137 TaxID=3346030 RepID=UPI0036431992